MVLENVQIRLTLHNKDELMQAKEGQKAGTHYSIIAYEKSRIKEFSPQVHFFYFQEILGFNNQFETARNHLKLPTYIGKSDLFDDYATHHAYLSNYATFSDFNQFIETICSDSKPHSIFITRVFKTKRSLDFWFESNLKKDLGFYGITPSSPEETTPALLELSLLFLAVKSSKLHIDGHGGSVNNKISYRESSTSPWFYYSTSDFVKILDQAKCITLERPVNLVYKKYRCPLYALVVHLNICLSGAPILETSPESLRSEGNIKSLVSMAEEFSANLLTFSAIPSTVVGSVFVLGVSADLARSLNKEFIARVPLQLEIAHCIASVQSPTSPLKNTTHKYHDLRRFIANQSSEVPLAKVKIIRYRSGEYKKHEYFKDRQGSRVPYNGTLRFRIMTDSQWHDKVTWILSKIKSIASQVFVLEDQNLFVENSFSNILSDLQIIVNPETVVPTDTNAYQNLLSSLKCVDKCHNCMRFLFRKSINSGKCEFCGQQL